MQKIRPLILVAAMAAAGSVAAATVGITIDGGGSNSYTLGSLSVDSSGNATVIAVSNGTPPPTVYAITLNPGAGGTINGPTSAAAGSTATWTAQPDGTNTFVGWGGACSGTAPTCTKTVNSALTVSASFTGDGGGVVGAGNCPAVDPAKVTVVNTAVAGSYYPRTDNSSVAPDHVYAYRFTTQNTAGLGNWIATRLTAATTGKLVKITQCPGVLDATNTAGACERATSESTRIDYVVSRPELNTRSYCHLQPNTVYYANVVSKNHVDDAYYSCGTANATGVATTKCGFSMAGQ